MTAFGVIRGMGSYCNSESQSSTWELEQETHGFAHNNHNTLHLSCALTKVLLGEVVGSHAKRGAGWGRARQVLLLYMHFLSRLIVCQSVQKRYFSRHQSSTHSHHIHLLVQDGWHSHGPSQMQISVCRELMPLHIGRFGNAGRAGQALPTYTGQYKFNECC